ncbi:MAG: HYR domain-containing protein, partial [Saprospiraceae bacterium]
MKQMPRFLKYLTLVVSFASMLIPAARLIHLNSNELIQEGYHPKNVNLASPLAITCQGLYSTTVTSGTCESPAKVKIPVSSCSITSLKYYIDKGIVRIKDTTTVMPIPPDSLIIGPLVAGTYSVRWILVDCNGQNFCSQTVIILDNTAPLISCPSPINICDISDIPLYNTLDQFIAAGGSASDPCGLSIPSFTRVTTNIVPVPGSDPTQYCIEYSIRDINNNLATCQHKIFLDDQIPPTPMCKDVTVDLNNTGDTTLMASIFDNNSTDNCGAPLTFSTIPSPLYYSCDSIDTSPNKVTLIVTDRSGNTATCSANVTVRDLILPTIICPANVTINADANQCYATNVIASLGQPITNDNCLPVKDTLRRFNGDTLKTTTQLPVGTNAIVWIVTDQHNNTNTCSQQVTVKDNQVPLISCPANITINAAQGTCSANANYATPVGTDNCPGVTTMQTTGLVSGASFPVGVTTNIFKATDASGNTSTCGFTVTVRDSEIPLISCPSDITMNA